MHHSSLLIIMVIAIFQALAWVARKKVINNKNLDLGAIKMFESTLITVFLFTYILMTTDINILKDTLYKFTKTDMLYMGFVAVCVVITVTLVFSLIRIVDISKLSPSISIARIILLSILGFMIFGEKMTMRKIIALVFMITGITMMMKT